MAGHLPVLSILIGRRPYAWNQHVLIGRSGAVPSVCGNPSEGLCTLLPARILIKLLEWDQTKEKKEKVKKRSGCPPRPFKSVQLASLFISRVVSRAFLRAPFQTRCAAVALILFVGLMIGKLNC